MYPFFKQLKIITNKKSMSEQVKFYRGNFTQFENHKNPETDNTGEIILVNDAIDNASGNSSYGAIYQDDKIVGTTRAEQLMTTADITVAGGPLANDIDDNWPADTNWTVGGVKTIPAGTSIQEILEKLFLKETQGTVSWSAVTWNPVMGKPTATLSSNGPVEVGSTVTATIIANQNVTGNTRYATMTASSEGYFDSIGGDHINSTSKTVPKDGSKSGTATTSHTWNGTETTETSLVVGEGTNTLVVTQTGLSASVDALPTTTVYASTNTKKCLAGVSATLTDTKPETKILANTENSDTIVGKYYCCYGIVPTGTTFTDTNIKSLSNKVFLDNELVLYTASDKLVANANQTFIIAVPSTYEIKQALNEFGQSVMNSVQDDELDYKLPNNDTKSYTVYYIDFDANNTQTYGYKITKKTN